MNLKLRDNLLAFIFGCMTVRLLLAFVAKKANKKWLKIMGMVAVLPATGFLYLFLTGARDNVPGAFGEQIWWSLLRPVHSILYFLFAYSAISGNPKAWIYLLTDALIGLVGFLFVHSINGDFSKAFL
jgi:hypothetical protein